MKTLRLSAIVVVVLTVATSALCAGYRVLRIIDGDTIKVGRDGKVVIVHLAGLDAPEIGYKSQPYSHEAAKHLAGLVLNREVTLEEYGVDRHGHMLAEVFVGGTNVNFEMVRAGYAEVDRESTVRGLNTVPYQKAETEARNQHRGMWVQGDKYVSPHEWRLANRETFARKGKDKPGIDKPIDTPMPGNLNAYKVVDDILKNMQLGTIAFNVPSSMNLEDTALLHLVLSLTKQVEELKKLIEEKGRKEGARIRISNFMEATLSGPNFHITAITPARQVISAHEDTEWKWEIQPQRTGTNNLHLVLNALFTIEGRDRFRTVKSFDKTIEVKVTFAQTLMGFFRENWKWLWTTLLAPAALILWGKLRKKKHAA